jgi:hypothetical protein
MATPEPRHVKEDKSTYPLGTSIRLATASRWMGVGADQTEERSPHFGETSMMVWREACTLKTSRSHERGLDHPPVHVPHVRFVESPSNFSYMRWDRLV